jgi:hypothetical protein
MLVIRVELWSAITGKRTELARMHISNVGGTDTRGEYFGETFRGRTAHSLNKRTVSRTGEVTDWPRKRAHVWKLVTKMLTTMGY